MKLFTKLLLFFTVFGLLSCENNSKQTVKMNQEKTIPAIEIAKDSLFLNSNEGNWYYKDQLFTGYAVIYYANDTLQQKIGFYKGKKLGVAKIWYPNGALKTVSHYKENKLIDSYKTWWENGVLATETYYKNGKIQGVEKSWYRNGELAKLRNLEDGRELGLQQAWLKNGKLYVNYEAKNGRIFGMRRANSCYKLEDEKVVQSK